MILNETNYFSQEADTHYMSASQFKSFAKCENKALAKINRKWSDESSTALLVGSYVDAHFSSALDLFKAQHPDIYKRDGSLKAEYEQANNIIQRIEREPAFMRAISGQSQLIMTGEIEGIPVKIKVDSLLPERIVDLKIMRDMEDVYSEEDHCRVPFWKGWGYDVQGAIYQEIVRQNTGKVLPFRLAVATKEKPEPNIDIVPVPQEALDEAFGFVSANIVYFDGLKKGLYEPERCEKCDYCYSTKVLEWEDLKHAE